MSKAVSAIMGLCVGDALGVPVEFNSRENLKSNPVYDMRGYGTYNQPPGTWSDDTSMTLCLADSLASGLNYWDIMVKFSEWFTKGKYTPHGSAFDIGLTTNKALSRFTQGIEPLSCGCIDEKENGNGSLMRILPLVFYLRSAFGADFYKSDASFQVIHNISALTHCHPRSKVACGIYICIAGKIIEGENIKEAVNNGISAAKDFYHEHNEFFDQWKHFRRILGDDFQKTDERSIYSSGYVIDSLEASIWCLLNTSSYKECVLKAVNLGEDTDTVGAIAGGLAGLYYGIENIPSKWLSKLQKREYVEGISQRLDQIYL